MSYLASLPPEHTTFLLVLAFSAPVGALLTVGFGVAHALDVRRASSLVRGGR